MFISCNLCKAQNKYDFHIDSEFDMLYNMCIDVAACDCCARNMKGKAMEKKKSKSCSDGICPCDTKCPLGKALAMIGGRWKLRLLCTLFVDGTQRYNDLLKKTKGITNAMLSSSLKELEANGLITRKQYEQIPPRVEYALTEHGKELWPILHQLAHWATGESLDGDSELIHIEA